MAIPTTLIFFCFEAKAVPSVVCLDTKGAKGQGLCGFATREEGGGFGSFRTVFLSARLSPSQPAVRLSGSSSFRPDSLPLRTTDFAARVTPQKPQGRYSVRK